MPTPNNIERPVEEEEDDDNASIDEEQIQMLRDQFHVFDVDGDGYIGEEELKQGLKRLGESVSKKDFKRMIKSIKGDSDDSGELRMTFEQFIVWNQSLFVLNMEDMFAEIDTDKSGWLSHDEIKQYYQKTGQDYTDEDIELFCQQVDFDDDGRMQVDEFISAMAADRSGHAYFICNAEMYLAKLKAEFAEMDRNGDGYVTREELYQGSAEGGHGLSAQEIEEIMADLDKDGDGQISLEEFISAAVGFKQEKSKNLKEKVETKRRTKTKTKKKSKKKEGKKDGSKTKKTSSQ